MQMVVTVKLILTWLLHKGGGALPYLNMVGNVYSIDPRFWHILNLLGLLLCPTRSYWPPLSAKIIGLSLSHLVPEIIWSKVGILFHKNQSFGHFQAFVLIFSLISILLPPLFINFFFFFFFYSFSIILTPLFSLNLRSRWVHFFIACCTPYRKFGEVPPPLTATLPPLTPLNSEVIHLASLPPPMLHLGP